MSDAVREFQDALIVERVVLAAKGPTFVARTASAESADSEAAKATSRTDRSTHDTVVEYAVRTMMKGKSPTSAAKDTVKKLSGSENMFFGPGITLIDPKTLEGALWDRMVKFTVDRVHRIKPGMEHYALDGTIQHFNQAPGLRAELKKRVLAKAGNLFPNDDAKGV